VKREILSITPSKELANLVTFTKPILIDYCNALRCHAADTRDVDGFSLSFSLTHVRSRRAKNCIKAGPLYNCESSLIFQHVRFNRALTPLFFFWCRVIQPRDGSPHNFNGLVMSGLAFSVTPYWPLADIWLVKFSIN